MGASLAAPLLLQLLRLRFRRTVVAVSDRIARLRLVRLQALLARLQLADGDGLDQMTLPTHQLVDGLQRFTRLSSQARDRIVVAHVAVHSRLSRAYELLVP